MGQPSLGATLRKLEAGGIQGTRCAIFRTSSFKALQAARGRDSIHCLCGSCWGEGLAGHSPCGLGRSWRPAASLGEGQMTASQKPTVPSPVLAGSQALAPRFQLQTLQPAGRWSDRGALRGLDRPEQAHPGSHCTAGLGEAALARRELIPPVHLTLLTERVEITYSEL